MSWIQGTTSAWGVSKHIEKFILERFILNSTAHRNVLCFVSAFHLQACLPAVLSVLCIIILPQSDYSFLQISWSWNREFVKLKLWNREFMKLKSWIHEVEFVKLNLWSWNSEFTKLNSWSWNREFMKLKSLTHEAEIVNFEFRMLKTGFRK
jgi:hypothetical protein